MSETPTIFQALNAAMRDVGAVRKEQVNQHQRFNFRGVDAVVNAVSPAFREHGIIVAPTLLEKELKETRTSKGAIMEIVHLTVRYTFFGPAGDKIEATVAAESFDSGDKATAKAMSVAFRTALLQTLALPTDETDDPDHHTFERGGPQRRPSAQTPATPGPVVRAERAQIEKAAALMDQMDLTDEKIEAVSAWASGDRTRDFAELSTQDMDRVIEWLEKALAERVPTA